MDAKSKAQFINSVTGGQKKTCSTCGAVNDLDAKFCYECGTSFENSVSAEEEPAVEPVEVESVEKKPEETPQVPFAPVDEKKDTEEKVNAKDEKVKEAFSAIEKTPDEKSENTPGEEAAPKKVIKYVEVKPAFAEGLPEWDIVPPQVVVRRVRK